MVYNPIIAQAVARQRAKNKPAPFDTTGLTSSIITTDTKASPSNPMIAAPAATGGSGATPPPAATAGFTVPTAVAKQIKDYRAQQKPGFSAYGDAAAPVDNTPRYSGMVQSATKNTPFVARVKNATINQVKPADYTDILQMDKQGLQDYIDAADIAVKNGGKISPDEEFRLRKANQQLQQLSTAPQTSPYDEAIKQMQAQYDELKNKLESGNATQADLYRKQLDMQYEAQKQQQLDSGERTKQSTQSALSFSGFGRSTFNADKQTQIQQNTENAITALNQAKELEYQKYIMQQQGATAEQLGGLSSQIASLQAENKKYLIDSAMKINEEQVKLGMDYGTKVENIVKLAGSMPKQDYESLDGKTKRQVDGWAQSIINANGDIDENLLKVVPASLATLVLQMAGEKRGVTGNYDYSAPTAYGQGVIYDKKTGKVVQNIAQNPVGDYSMNKDGQVIDSRTGAVTSGGVVSLPDGSIDLRGKASMYPNEASLKNNNPAGITYNDKFAQTLTNLGIKFTKGTPRPSAEGGQYFSFPTIQEGMKAYDYLWSSPSYQNLTVGQALSRWGTDSVPGVPTNVKVSQLSPEQLATLKTAQLKKESPGMYKELQSLQSTGGAANGGQPVFKNKDQADAYSYAKRVEAASKIMNSIDIANKGYSAAQMMYYRNAPAVLNGTIPPVVQQQLQAERDFVNAVLRRESGAAISSSEFESAKSQYFPMPGDSKEVIAQKKKNRETTLQNLKTQSANSQYFDSPATNGQPSTSTGGASSDPLGIL